MSQCTKMRGFAAVVLCCVYFYASISPSRVLGYDVKSLSSHSWTVKNGNNSFQLNATVPGGVYTDLSRAGVLVESIFNRSNDVKYRWVAYENWTYSTTFTVEEVNPQKKYELVFHGLDGHAVVVLNDRSLGKAENTFVRYRFDVTRVLRKENHLAIQFESPIVSGRRRAAQSSHSIPPNCVLPDYHGECHVNQLRRMPASFGWDWGLAAPSVGVWKQVELVAFASEYDLRVRDLIVSIQSSEDERWIVGIKVECETAMHGKWYVLRAKSSVLLTVENGEVMTVANSTDLVHSPLDRGVAKFGHVFFVPKSKVKLWWPNGYGEQPLYNLTVTIETEYGSETRTVFVGFRETKLVQDYVDASREDFGRNFYFVVNGVKIFAKGSNYIPHSIFLEEAANNETIIRLLSAAREANMNMLRVWGGGIYADDLFYKECDRLGIMVWQDMMFACSMYPSDDAFLANVRTEISQQIGRLQYHPSIVVWAGNNENEAALRDDWYGTKNDFNAYAREYVKLYVNTIREAVLARDPTRPFLVSSPTNGLQSEEEGHIAANPGNVLYGDVHYYKYTVNQWVYDDYPLPRFASEYGVQSLPSLFSLRRVATVDDLHSFNTDFFVHRQHIPFGNLYLVYQMLLQFSAPKLDDLAGLIYLSQVNQAWAVKSQSEWYRRWRSTLEADGRGRTSGAMYWQLNDIWDAPSWSSIEFSGKWKMLHYYAKRFFAPVIVTAHVKSNGQITCALVSDLLYDLDNVELAVTIFRWNSLTPLRTIRRSVTVRNQSAQEILSGNVDKFFADNAEGCGGRAKCFVKLNLTDSKTGELIHENFLFPSALKDAEGIQPSTVGVQVKSCNVNACTLEVNASAISLFVWMDVEEIAGRFSDNGFMMTEPQKTVQFYPERSTSPGDLIIALSLRVLDDADFRQFSFADHISQEFIGRFFKNRKDFDHFYTTGQIRST